MGKLRLLAGRNEGDGASGCSGTCGASDAVDVVFGFVGNVVVDNHGYVVDVDASCHDVGGYEYVDAGGPETEHDFVALALFEVGVDLGNVEVCA